MARGSKQIAVSDSVLRPLGQGPLMAQSKQSAVSDSRTPKFNPLGVGQYRPRMADHPLESPQALEQGKDARPLAPASRLIQLICRHLNGQ